MKEEPAANALRSLWSTFPLVVCINLRERQDRFEEVKAEFQRVGLRRMTFVRTERQPDRDKAIIDAHMACLRLMRERGAPFALIFEDDVQFQEGLEENLGRCVEFLRSNTDWRIFYLGGFIFRKCERLGPHILRGAVLTNHAYVIRSDFAEEALRRRPYCRGMSIDLFYSSLIGNRAYVHVNPLVCIQRPSESDGTWDTRSLNKEGWLGNAMVFTSLDFADRMRFPKFSMAERIRIQNGILFFKVFRWIQQRKLLAAERAAAAGKGVEAVADGPAPVVEEVVLEPGSA